MTGHTPGPWTPPRRYPKGKAIIYGGGAKVPAAAGLRVICTVEGNGDAESDANARLIAASPQAHAALVTALGVLLDIAEAAGDVPMWNRGGEGYAAVDATRDAIEAAS